MDKKEALEVIKKAKENSIKRKFNQRVDLIINLKNIDLKKPEQQIDLFLTLPKGKGKKTTVCALVGPELIEDAKKDMDFAIIQDEFDKYKDKKLARKLAAKYDFFVAQANIMPKVAGAFGRVLGVRGKMPNPKSGCVVPPKANLKTVHANLQNVIRVSAKTSPMIQIAIGNEGMPDEDLAENFLAVYNAVLHALPQERNNLRKITIKTTMGKPVPVM
jgi:large subunit ribosomal protein L1